MQQLRALLILSAAYDLSRDRHSTMQNIARAVTHAVPRGPVAVTTVATILELALSGRSGKWIAYELDVSESGVTRALRSALTKIGAAHTSDLLGLPEARFEPLRGLKAGVTLAMARLSPARPLLATLSGAERAIVTGIADGKRVIAIARERGTSPRTVSHQLASIYRKLGASSRREALALLQG